jgi:SHS2 domain-containing protein
VGADDLPGLMQAWLSELLYRFAAEKRVGTAFEIRSIGRPAAGAPFRLEAVVREEPFDPRRHAVEAEIKAVTFHQLRVAERPRGGWEAQMIFDV